MHWIEYFHFVHSRLPNNKEMKDYIKKLGIASFKIHTFIYEFKNKN